MTSAGVRQRREIPMYAQRVFHPFWPRNRGLVRPCSIRIASSLTSGPASGSRRAGAAPRHARHDIHPAVSKCINKYQRRGTSYGEAPKREMRYSNFGATDVLCRVRKMNHHERSAVYNGVATPLVARGLRVKCRHWLIDMLVSVCITGPCVVQPPACRTIQEPSPLEA
jgi:hypothetical protein